MGYKQPTRRKAKREDGRLNLIPILDSVFIFLFFLLMSTQFLKIFEIGSDIPILSAAEPPKTKKKPLALTVTVEKSGFNVYTGVPSVLRKRIPKDSNGDYNLESLHTYLVNLKKTNRNEKSVILEPNVNLKYQEIINIMDSVRMLKNTDDQIFRKDKDGIEVQVKELFNKIVFGNLMS